MSDQTQPVHLAVGETITLSIGGLEVDVEAGVSEDGCPFVELGGKTCNLEGELPGLYYLTPVA